MKIEIDTEVFEAIKAKAEPFVDTPNSVLRRQLGLDGPGSVQAEPSPGRGERAAPGSILPEAEYELPILLELLERGGSGHATEVTNAVGERLGSSLTELDRGKLKTGDIRWRNRVQFTRLNLRKRGYLKADSPRGVWELTDKGREAARSEEVTS
jgi:hypothetical protein